MFVRLAMFEVRPEAVEDFIGATLGHVASSRSEKGISRFEFYRGEEPNHYLLFIQFESEEARSLHFETEHIKQWRSRILPLLAKPIGLSTYFPIEQP